MATPMNEMIPSEAPLFVWLTTLPPTAAPSVAAKRCCSFCKKTDHTIQKCSNIRIFMELDKIEIKIESSISVLVNELARTSRNGTFDSNQFSNLIRSFIMSWIRNYDKTTLLAMCFKIKEQTKSIYGEQYVTTKMKKRNLMDVLVFHYSAIIADAIHFHKGNFTTTFRSFITQKMLKFLGEIGISDDPEMDARRYYHFIRNYNFYDKTLNNYQLLDVLHYMRDDAYYSHSFLLLGHEKCARMTIIMNSMEAQLNKTRQPPFKFTMSNEFIGCCNDDGGFDCPICLEQFKSEKEVILNCGHIFCKDCLFTTIETNIQKEKAPPCPLCRNLVEKVSIRNETDYNEFMARFENNV